MEIKSAEFVISNTNVKKCPAGELPEYAFIGRSNVGKSSLINMLTGKKGLAMTSQKPGKTMVLPNGEKRDAKVSNGSSKTIFSNVNSSLACLS